MRLEVITRKAADDGTRPQLLFIHGAFHAAWCWDVFYLPFFAEQGWTAHALSLRGHGASEGADRLNHWSLTDYDADVLATVTTIAHPVVLVGHSMGGVLAQRCAATDANVAGAAFLASSPLRPSPRVVGRMLARHPFRLVAGSLLRSMHLARPAFTEFFFAEDLDAATRASYVARLSGESDRAVKQVFRRQPPIVASTERRPFLVLGGADDWSIPRRDHDALAQAYRASLTIVRGAHDLMLDPRWREGAEALLHWLDRSFAAGEEAR